MHRLLTTTAIVAAAALVPAAAGAQSRATFTPSLSISSVYDDNLFARSVGSGDQMTLLSPGLEASFENPTAAFLGAYTFDMQRSFETLEEINKIANDLRSKDLECLQKQWDAYVACVRNARCNNTPESACASKRPPGSWPHVPP